MPVAILGAFATSTLGSNNGTTVSASVSSAGAQGNGNSYWGNGPADRYISADGRFVGYESDSTTAVANDTNGKRDIFVRDRQAAATERVNVSSTGAQAVTVGPSVSEGSGRATLSRDGRYVAFKSHATNLDPADSTPFNFQDIFVHDRVTGLTTIESVSTADVQGNSESEGPALSADGTTLAFASFATNFMPLDTNFAPDIFVRVRATALTQAFCTAGTSSAGCVASLSGLGAASASTRAVSHSHSIPSTASAPGSCSMA